MIADTVTVRCVAGGLIDLAEAHHGDTVPSPDHTATRLTEYARRLDDLIADTSTAPTSATRHFGPGWRVDRRMLVPGTSVRRYTQPAGGDQLDTQVPCCDRPARVRRGLDQAHALIGCPYCGLSYAGTVIAEDDGGFAVALEVRDEEFVTAGRRRPAVAARRHGAEPAGRHEDGLPHEVREA